MHRVLDHPMRVFRIGDPEGEWKIFSGKGSALVDGRWHEKSQEVIYASEHYSTALLEKLAHFNGSLPRGQHFVEIHIPAGVSYEVVTKDSLPEWCLDGSVAARSFGSAWYRARRSALLIVPSYVAREERNVIVNVRHSDFVRLTCGLEQPVAWDARLFDPR